MSDVMLLGVLRMPPELWHNTPLDVVQRHGRYVEAADTIEALRSQLSECQRELVEEVAMRDKWINYAFVGAVVPPLPNGRAKELPTAIESLQQQLQQMKEALKRATRFAIGKDGTTIELTGENSWAIRRGSACMAKDGFWEWEPMSSSRDEEFLKRTRWDSYDAAARALVSGKGE